MVRSGKTAIAALARSPRAWLLVGGSALCAWAWLSGGFPGHAPLAPHQVPPQPQFASNPAAVPAAATPTVPAQAARVAPVEAAAIGVSTIQVVVGRNDTLDHIFRRLQLSLSDLATLRGLPGVKTALDRLRPGEALTLRHRDSTLVGLQRRLSLEETLQVTRQDAGFQATVLKNTLDKRPRTVAATIDSSLFEAVTAAGAHEQTALALADIFAWDIDFVLDIQPGDSFTVTYDEIWENGKYVQDGPILAARFINQNHEYLAARYVAPDGSASYYSPDGRSMRKAFLRAPVDFTRVSSRFDLHRYHPILNLIRAHKGIDYAAPIGTPVHAAGDGRIAFAGRKGGYGNVLEIDHSRGIVTVYGHLSRFAPGMRPGRRVEQGTVVAYVGMTGLATGPHLHYEYRVNGAFKNPQTVKFPEAVPIDAGLREDFLAQTAPLLATLDPPLGPALVAR